MRFGQRLVPLEALLVASTRRVIPRSMSGSLHGNFARRCRLMCVRLHGPNRSKRRRHRPRETVDTRATRLVRDYETSRARCQRAAGQR
jgi:hypothetical protein